MEGDNSIVKSKYDNKDYRVINMENGLQALLVHDPNVATKGGPKKEGEQTKMSTAAAIIVGVGAIHAQKYSHGLPHLLEHMIGDGSKKFPIDVCSILIKVV
ncbi:metalloprotease [Trifolium repens]|nr:metalloprotease [Trifolium repens]